MSINGKRIEKKERRKKERDVKLNEDHIIDICLDAVYHLKQTIQNIKVEIIN
jgi:hypothetical protein